MVKHGELDLLAGCPPCQGFSTLRNKNKQCRLDDPRNRLIDEFSRLVTGLLPKVVLLENVPRLTDYTRYSRFKSMLRQYGYVVADKVLDVQEYGVQYLLNYGVARNNLEIGLTGSKLQAVAAAVLSARRKISQAWYISPKEFDEKRFTEGFGRLYVYKISRS
jgi:hypothetical protein